MRNVPMIFATAGLLTLAGSAWAQNHGTIDISEATQEGGAISINTANLRGINLMLPMFPGPETTGTITGTVTAPGFLPTNPNNTARSIEVGLTEPNNGAISDLVDLDVDPVVIQAGAQSQGFRIRFFSDSPNEPAIFPPPNLPTLVETGGLQDLSLLLNTGGALTVRVASEISEVPMPPTALLVGSGLLSLAGLGWRRRNK